MNWTLFVSIFLGAFIGRLVSDYLFKDEEKEKEEKEDKKDER